MGSGLGGEGNGEVGPQAPPLAWLRCDSSETVRMARDSGRSGLRKGLLTMKDRGGEP